MYPENPDGIRIIVIEHGYISDTARNRILKLFIPICAPIPLGNIDGNVPLEFYLLS